jgi:hypothetical protein
MTEVVDAKRGEVGFFKHGAEVLPYAALVQGRSRLTTERHPRGAYCRCQTASKCHSPYVPVGVLEALLASVYDAVEPAMAVLELVRLEIEAIASDRARMSEKEINRLKRQIADTAAKQLILSVVSEMPIPEGGYVSIRGGALGQRMNLAAT